jgi:hypothetical protein
MQLIRISQLRFRLGYIYFKSNSCIFYPIHPYRMRDSIIFPPLNTMITLPIPPGGIPCMPPCRLHGGKTKNASLLEPSGIEPSVRARRPASPRGGHGLHRQFLAYRRPKTDCSVQTPVVEPACRRSIPCAVLGDRPRLPTLRLVFALNGLAKVPSLTVSLRSPSASALRSARVPTLLLSESV